MNKEIEVKVHHHDYFIGMIEAFSIIAIFILLPITIRYYSIALLLFTVLLVILVALQVYLFEYRPTVIWSDGYNLYWQHIFKIHQVALNEIAGIKCEPYMTRGRYGTYQHIRLTISTRADDIDEIEFNDNVNANALIEEKLGNKTANIPIVQLYNYLKEHCKRSD